ncbi:MAG: glycosyltransferase family 9 protein [bacterium]|nr:glycosyltransferase family 9 protein [bacterium]
MTPLQDWLLERLRAQRANQAPRLEKSRILAVQIAGMGDFLLAVPAIRALRGCGEGARVDLLTSTKSARAAQGCPHVEEIFPVDLHSAPGNNAFTAGWGALLSALVRIRRKRYDLAVNLMGLYSPKGAVRMGLLFRSMGIPHLAGRDTRGAGTFYHTALAETLETPRNERDINLELIARLGIANPAGEALEIWPSAADEQTAAALADRLPGGGPLVGVNPGSDRPEKVWAEDLFLEVMRGLRQEKNARFLLTGGPAEAALTARLAQRFGEGAVDTVGRIGFHGTGALMRKMDLFLTCDTAALHLAWAAGAPSVALFKRENIGRYRPGTDRILCLVGRENSPAAPIQLTAADVLAACRKQIGARSGHRA